MPAERNRPKRDCFNRNVSLPFQLRLEDFEIAMQDVYDLFYDVNTGLLEKGLERLDDFVRPAIMSGLLSDLLTASLAKHSRVLTQNNYFNGHPDLLVKGVYPNDSVKAGTEGVEIKTTRKAGGAVDTHGARNQWLAVFVYNIDNETQPARERKAMTFHRNLSWPGHNRGFSAQSTWRTRNADGDATSRRDFEVAPKLDLQRSSYTLSARSFGSASRAISK